MTRIGASVIQTAGDTMSLIRRNAGLPMWDVAGCKALLRDCADLAPEHELAAAGVLFAGMTPGLRAPLREKFTDRSQPWWRGLPEAARTGRPSDAPKCASHGLPAIDGDKCRSCLADDKGADESAPVVMVDEAQAARNIAGAALVLAKLDEARRTE